MKKITKTILLVLALTFVMSISASAQDYSEWTVSFDEFWADGNLYGGEINSNCYRIYNIGGFWWWELPNTKTEVNSYDHTYAWGDQSVYAYAYIENKNSETSDFGTSTSITYGYTVAEAAIGPNIKYATNMQFIARHWIYSYKDLDRTYTK
ncbi:MAG: hypothetical protein A2Y17_01225 [Clostridiales bacterium GWF2_38_85]|nr:MAG: hypothetical protein A2Y17_01225 [Clostridiales bacterium GWF2_38_85]HBL85206.1 hypothetical protein [Clostridiales bacterium]